jgi:hypothetical protein
MTAMRTGDWVQPIPRRRLIPYDATMVLRLKEDPGHLRLAFHFVPDHLQNGTRANGQW